MPVLGRPMNSENSYRGVKKYDGPNNNLDLLQKIPKLKKTALKIVDGERHGKIGKDGFLRLLMHQLANQDPLKPIDQNKMAADLAQFSQLEQMSNMNKNLTKFLGDDLAKKKFFASSFLGKKVMTQGASIKYQGEGDRPTINFNIPQDIARGIVRIYDKNKQMISQFDLKFKSAGAHIIPWDGKQLDGMDAGKGIYTFQIKAWDESNNEVPVETQAEGRVSGVSFDERGEIVMTVNGKNIYLRDVKSFAF